MKSDPCSSPTTNVDFNPGDPGRGLAIGAIRGALPPEADATGATRGLTVNIDPYHDELGRFTTAGKSGILDAKYGYNLLTMKPNPPPVFDERTERNIGQLEPVVQDLARQHIYQARQAGIDLRIIDAFRTIAQQNALYAKGRTAPGPMVTRSPGGQSYHNYSVAYDVGVFKNHGKIYVDKGPEYDVVAKIGKRLGLQWGGDFGTGADKPHFEYTTGLTPDQMRDRLANDQPVIPKD